MSSAVARPLVEETKGGVVFRTNEPVDDPARLIGTNGDGKAGSLEEFTGRFQGPFIRLRLPDHFDQPGRRVVPVAVAGETEPVGALGAVRLTGVNAEALGTQFDQDGSSRVHGGQGRRGSEKHEDPGAFPTRDRKLVVGRERSAVTELTNFAVQGITLHTCHSLHT